MQSSKSNFVCSKQDETDASGGNNTAADPGAWAAALGQRKGTVDLANPGENFELLQLDGGMFNARQAEWDADSFKNVYSIDTNSYSNVNLLRISLLLPKLLDFLPDFFLKRQQAWPLQFTQKCHKAGLSSHSPD